MRYRVVVTAAVGGACVALGILLAGEPASGQVSPTYRAPRSIYGDGTPDLNGIWQALNTANYDLEDHPMAPGPMWQLGALGAVIPGTSVVEGGTIPYLPAAVARKKELFEKRIVADPFKRDQADPEVKCYMAGVPRSTYMPHPLQIVQTPRYVLIAYQYANSNRIVRMKEHSEAPVDSWMGWSNGRWEGETLVIDTEGFYAEAWLDRAGNYASKNLKVTERITPIDATHLEYEATLTDPTVYSRPWKIRMPLYKRIEKNAQLLEFRCVELSEEAIYGALTKKSSTN
jgi:hypothetical protein